jgi:aspartate aminotransferase
MVSISHRIAEITESQTLAMTKLSRELKSQGIDVINLSIGEPDFDTPSNICEAATTAMKEGFTHYPPVAGFPELRTAIAQKLQRENKLTYSAENILVSNGAKHSILNVILSIINPGDEVIIPAPFWVSYPSIVEYAGGKPIYIESGPDQDFKVTAEQIKSHISDKTKAILFSSPCNPSGSVLNYAELLDWVHVLKDYPSITIISDEIYEKINYNGAHVSIASFPEVFERTIIVNGMSKGYAMTGWRMGYIAGPVEIIKACEKIQGLMTSGANSIAQMASIAALNGPQDSVKSMAMTFKERRDLFHSLLSAIPNISCNLPTGAFYLLPDVSRLFGKLTPDGDLISNAEDLCMYLLMHGHVSTVSGAAFGVPNCIRLSYATSEENLKIAAERISNVISNLID